MAVNRANRLYMNQSMPPEDTSIHYKPRSDFINLSKLNALVLARKLEAEERKESQGTLTLRRWIWENLANFMAILANETRVDIEMRTTIEKKINNENTDGDTDYGDDI